MSIAPLRKVTFSYFVIGVVMYGSGLITYDQIGIVSFLFEGQTTGGEGIGVFKESADVLRSVGSILGITAFASAILATVDFLTSLFTFLFWPFIVLQSSGVPFTISLLLGGSVSFLFFLSVLDALSQR